MCSACRLMVFNVCVKFHENMSSGFKVMERTRKLLTDTHTHTHTQRKDKNIIPPWHTSYAGGIIKCRLLQFLFGALRVKLYFVVTEILTDLLLNCVKNHLKANSTDPVQSKDAV